MKSRNIYLAYGWRLPVICFKSLVDAVKSATIDASQHEQTLRAILIVFATCEYSFEPDPFLSIALLVFVLPKIIRLGGEINSSPANEGFMNDLQRSFKMSLGQDGASTFSTINKEQRLMLRFKQIDFAGCVLFLFGIGHNLTKMQYPHLVCWYLIWRITWWLTRSFTLESCAYFWLLQELPKSDENQDSNQQS